MVRDLRAGGILSYFTRHRTLANLLLVLMVASGLIAFPQMRAQFFPDVVIDNVTVSVSWDGAGAEDVDAGIVQVLEPVLLAVEGVESSEATAREGSASITLDFEPNWDVARGFEDVSQAVDGVTTLPDASEEPTVRRGAWRDRVTDIVITGPVGTDQLARFADELTTRLFAVGVTRTSIRGIAAPETLVEVPSIALIEHDLTLTEIAEAIRAEADADPAGDVPGAERIRTGTAKRSADEIEAITLRTNDDGSSLSVGDVAIVTIRGIDRNAAYFVRENPAITMRVDRSAQGDAIEIQRLVEEVAAEMVTTLPEGVSIDLIRERAEYISGRLDILMDNAVVGLALVLSLLFFFLNARTAFWVAAGIPVALFAAIGLMWLAGITINMISLFALIITLGIVVDDAIVVGEHADFRVRNLGEEPVIAAENAAKRMFTPVFSATLTTVIAFFGLVVIGGRFGDLIADIPFTVIVVLIASLIECFLILPNHMSHALKTRDQRGSAWNLLLALILLPVIAGVIAVALVSLTGLAGPFSGWTAPETLRTAAIGGAIPLAVFLLLPRARKTKIVAALRRDWYDAPSRNVTRGFNWVRQNLFKPLIRTVIVLRYPVLAATVFILSTQVALFASGQVQWRFFNSPEENSVTGNFMMTNGATREDTLVMMREMQRATEELGAEYEERYGANPLDFVMAQIGGNAGRGMAGAENKDDDLLGGISIELIDADLRPYSSFAFVGELQDRVTRLPLVEDVSFRSWRGGPGGDAIDVQLYGADSATLKAAAEELKTQLGQFPEVSALEDSLAYDRDEVILDLTPQGEALGFTIDDLGQTLRNRLEGIEAATYPDGPRSAEIRVEIPDSELTADFLERTQLRTPDGAYVPLADIVSVDRRTGFSTITRENGLQVVSVSGDINEDDANRAAVISEQLETEILPEIRTLFSVETQLAGLAEQEDEFLNDARLGFILVLLGIYLVLSWIFASWSRPFVVMAIIPFGLVGTIFGHWLHDVPLSMFTVVGLIGMTGIVINDSIVLVTTIDEYAKERGLVPAIIDGAADRLRPVLLTTLTTVLGLAPLLFERSSQAQFLKPTVITLVYGLGFGMLIVLLVVPALMAMQQDVGRALTALRRAGQAGSRAAGRPAATAIFGAQVVALVLFGVILAPVIFTGAPLAAFLPATASAAAGAFLAALALSLVVTYVLTASLGRRMR
ncbi:efflux RND transporter permease subunit [Aestuariibius sp. 2305UL40-4]|uniref:efflux RND transporter permease subunit n=1 Tax=Aestuariibius violaceus TaxID=3234132 RepID=UPI00345E7A90